MRLRRVVYAFCAACLACCSPVGAAEATATATVAPAIAADQAERDLRILRRALESLHPGLFRRITPAELDAVFARARAEVQDGSDALEMYRIATRIAASIRCGHTWTNTLNQSDAVRTALDALPALPFRVRIVDSRILVTASASEHVAVGSEVLSIDGRSPKAIIAALWPYLRADGDSDGKRSIQLDADADGGALDRLLPQIFPPAAGGYVLRLRRPTGRVEEVAVDGMPVSAREASLTAAGMALPDDRWRLDIDAGTAVLSLPTFAFWNETFDWRGFLDDAFARLDREHIDRLVLDLRRNEGGDLAIADALLAKLIDAPLEVPPSTLVSAYERAPYILVRYLDTWNYDFFDRTGQVRYVAERRWELLDQPKPRRIEPAADRYRGRVAMLVGPRMSSAGFLVARDFKASGRGILIGQPTGGSQRGLNGGELAWLTLPASGVAVDIPLLAGFTPGTDTATPPPDRGVDPDLRIDVDLEDVAAGRDPELQAALRWLRRRTR